MLSYKPKNEEKLLSCSLQSLEVFSCCLAAEDETALSIIDPMTISIELNGCENGGTLSGGLLDATCMDDRPPLLEVSDQFFPAEGMKGRLEPYAMNRVAASAHLSTLGVFEPAKHPDDIADYCLCCSFSGEETLKLVLQESRIIAYLERYPKSEFTNLQYNFIRLS